jgi:hypothetical protein
MPVDPGIGLSTLGSPGWQVVGCREFKQSFPASLSGPFDAKRGSRRPKVLDNRRCWISSPEA